MRPKHGARTVLAATALLSGLILGSCSGGSVANERDDGGGKRSACSTGPDYPEDFVFPSEPVDPNENEYPSCLPRCGLTAQVTRGSLPSGACEVEGERCHASLSYFCGTTSGGLGRLDGMRCTCTDGSWRCVIITMGGGVCLRADASVRDAEQEAADAGKASLRKEGLRGECMDAGLCPAGEMCVRFDNIDPSVPEPQCVAEGEPRGTGGCALVICPTGQTCVNLGSGPVQVACGQVK
jgi:hypothetical protein